jgi:hypothetical protein
MLENDLEDRKLLAKEPIIWKGDLSDDCTAEWAGLMLRAERMDEDYWWWAVYDMQENEITIDSSNEYDTRFIGGDAARAKAESVARIYLRIES